MCSPSGTRWVIRCAPMSTWLMERSIEVPPLVLSVPAGLIGGRSGKASETRSARAAVERGDRSNQRDAGGEPRRSHPSRRDRRKHGGWRTMPTGANSSLRTWKRRSANTWGMRRPVSWNGSFARSRKACEKSQRNVRAQTSWSTLCDRLIAELVAAARILDSKGVTDRSKIDAIAGPIARARVEALATARRRSRVLLHGLERGFRRVEQIAQRDGPDEAASELTSVYMTDFEPLERYLLGRRPQEVRPLEIQFNRLRGDVSGGLKGEELHGAARSALRARSRAWSPSSKLSRPAGLARRSWRRSSRSCAKGSR